MSKSFLRFVTFPLLTLTSAGIFGAANTAAPKTNEIQQPNYGWDETITFTNKTGGILTSVWVEYHLKKELADGPPDETVYCQGISDQIKDMYGYGPSEIPPGETFTVKCEYSNDAIKLMAYKYRQLQVDYYCKLGGYGYNLEEWDQGAIHYSTRFTPLPWEEAVDLNNSLLYSSPYPPKYIPIPHIDLHEQPPFKIIWWDPPGLNPDEIHCGQYLYKHEDVPDGMAPKDSSGTLKRRGQESGEREKELPDKRYQRLPPKT